MDIQEPSEGRIIHVFHNGNKEKMALSANGANKVPAIVTQHFGGLICNCQAFTNDQYNPSVMLMSLKHKSEVPKKEGTEELEEGIRYWDWPERK